MLLDNFIFSTLTSNEREEFVDAFEKKEVVSGDFVIRQGERYLIFL